jgi:predicted O-methyltransferase YrrM
VLGLAQRGFFVPHRYANRVAPVDYPALAPLFEAVRPAFDEVLQAIESHAEALRQIGGAPPAPRFDQAWFPPLDAMAAYALVRRRRPARIVEIGSGHSTRFLARAVRDGALASRITCIDPAPRAALAGLDVDWLHVLLQEAPRAPFEALAGGDVLFVDSSHVAMPGSDVDLVLNDLLPRLAPGVLVHLHDIFLPDRYPAIWDWRGYNEQGAVGALLQGGAYALQFASHWVATRLVDRLEAGVIGACRPPGSALESSLWLEKRA